MRRFLDPKLLRLSERLNNDFNIETDYNKQPVTIQFKGFIENAKKMETLQAKDIANAILYAVESPSHVNVNEVLIRPTTQER